MKVWKEGGCHCGAVRMRVHHTFTQALDCNCSICRKKGLLHLIVQADDFQLICGAASLSTYTFNTGQAKHHFCKTCGVSPYYIPRSHPDGFDVNLRCLDDVDMTLVTVTSFDGDQWEENIANIAGYDQ